MGYYFIQSPEMYEKLSSEKGQMIWVGDDAFDSYFSLFDKGIAEWSTNLEHQLITFNRFTNQSSKTHHTILNEIYPLWEEDYNLEELINAFEFLKEQHFTISNNDLFLIGNPSELIVQAFIHFLAKNANNEFAKIQMVLLSDPSMKLVYSKEIREIEQLILKHSGYAIEVESDKFNWPSFISTANKELEIKSKKEAFLRTFKKPFHG